MSAAYIRFKNVKYMVYAPSISSAAADALRRTNADMALYYLLQEARAVYILLMKGALLP